MMRIHLYICLLLFAALPVRAQEQAKEQHFFETLYDVPVMEGLEEVPDMGLSFDKAGGRIAEAGAKTDILSDREVLSFYNTALKQMGWEHVEGSYAPYIYVREGEKLSIFSEKSEGSSVYRFLLEPEIK